ncbi:hypothetical protein GOEFS_121_00120 [Gordonia effusa NBRC 100432]|uniref:Uncharacterized protein n=1 Tax=Gordonia effusa NBRC 100432 TaxID=1077974 RepID=H0R6A9_9ACTN|nr:hypothetical protein [Gordonia effusa]GAB20610.1 hypothetical protein GOEFS_121_00120 [Gordonia effusa NBRC 100432]
MTTTLVDPWVERQIRQGRLAPGARGLSRAEAADQHNAANALTPEDHDYLYSPGQAQDVALAALSMVGVDLPVGTRVVLTDVVAGRCGRAYRANAGQVEAAVEEHRLTTGEAISAAGIVGAGTASADTAGGVADGRYRGNTAIKHADAVTGYVVLPVSVDGNSISVLGQTYMLTPTATGGTADILGQRVTLTANTLYYHLPAHVRAEWFGHTE